MREVRETEGLLGWPTETGGRDEQGLPEAELSCAGISEAARSRSNQWPGPARRQRPAPP